MGKVKAVTCSALLILLVPSSFQVTTNAKIHFISHTNITIIDMNTNCFGGNVVVGDNGLLVYGAVQDRSSSTFIMYTSNTSTQQVSEGIRIPISSLTSMTYIGK